MKTGSNKAPQAAGDTQIALMLKDMERQRACVFPVDCREKEVENSREASTNAQM